MDGVDKHKAIRKIKETKQYFLDVAQKKNPLAYKLLLVEIERLTEHFNLNWDK
jgi:hypothetical protein